MILAKLYFARGDQAVSSKVSVSGSHFNGPSEDKTNWFEGGIGCMLKSTKKIDEDEAVFHKFWFKW